MTERTPRPVYASPLIDQLVAVIGDKLTLQLVGQVGGTRIHLPRRVTATCRLSQLVGLAGAKALVAHFGHGELSLPTGRGQAHGRRLDHSQIRADQRAGMSVSKIALKWGCTERQVYNVLAPGQSDKRQMLLL